MSKIRWGILGCANTARKRAIPAMLQARSVDLVGIASRSPEKAESFQAMFNLPRAYASYEEMLADPQIQAVYIPLPNSLHGEWMVNAARQGKHVLCEKPFTSNASEAVQVAARMKEHRVCAMEAFMWRMHPQHARAMNLVDNGTIGAVRLIRAAFTFLIPRQPNVRLDAALAGGSVMDVGCYPVSTARLYFRGEPHRVFARGNIDPEYGVDMHAAAILEFSEGSAVFDCGFDLPYRTELEIVGEKGIISFPKPWQPDPEAVICVNGNSETLPAVNQYVLQFEYFSECVREGRPPSWGPDDAILQMRVLDAILRSISSGRPEPV